jgi:SAM-dependent methyltransferase
MNWQKTKNRIRWFLTSQLGINPKIAYRFVCGLSRYFKDLMLFRSQYSGRLDYYPALNDWGKEGGDTDSEYFWQDLLVARMLHEAKPIKHVDIGSRIDGFVAHVASFRSVEIFDVRPISKKIPNVNFVQADLMNPLANKKNYCDSISCLHAIEHFGLGRYGDPIDVNGYKVGLKNMAALLQDNGTFYLSTPIGVGRVEFNANRVFDPRIILREASKNQLQIQKLIVIDSDCSFCEYDENDLPLDQLAAKHYSLGIFIFKKWAPNS